MKSHNAFRPVSGIRAILAALVVLGVAAAASGAPARDSGSAGAAGASASGTTAAGKAAGAPPYGYAKIVYLEGNVTVDGSPAELGVDLPLRTTVKTGAASYCDIVFADKNAVRVAQNADAVLDFSAATVQISLDKGGVSAVLRKLATVSGSDDAFTVHTPSAVAGVRGTSFCLWTDGSSSYVCTCDGTVRTIDPKGSNEFVTTAAHHKAKLYAPAGSAYTVEAVGLMHHTDADLESLATRIGETIDWTKLDEK